MGYMPIAKILETATDGPKPESRPCILAQGNHRLVLAWGSYREVLDLFSTHPEKPRTPRTDPERAILGAEERPDAFVVEQVIRVVRGERAIAPNTQAAAIGSNPERAILLFGQPHHNVVSEPVASG